MYHLKCFVSNLLSILSRTVGYQNNSVSSNIYHGYIDFFGSVNKNAHRYQTLDKRGTQETDM